MIYYDYILLASGAFFLVVAASLGLARFLSRARDKEYRRVLREETERIDVVETMKQTRGKLTLESIGTRLASETDAMTEITYDDGRGVAQLPPNNDNSALDVSAVQGKYEFIREIHGGGMSRTFLARHRELGSVWIIKFVDGKYAELADEADVLRSLNHINLPQIIDIFQTQQGTFLVERYIEGYTLEEVLEQKQHLKEGLIYRWGIELAQVLNYLHNLDTPIIHCDLKPSNIMVTYDNHLVLIDFGIAKRQGISRRAIGISQRYAAPEQFQGALANSEMAITRFGKLPPAQPTWEIDTRTDLYSMGAILFELVTGHFPTLETQGQIQRAASSGLAKVISKCLQIEPSMRYQSAKELELALDGLVQMQTTMTRSLVKSRVIAICGIFALLVGLGTSASGAYFNQVETQAIVTMSPGEVSVTEQQGIHIQIQKETGNGRITTVDPDKVDWEYSVENIARIDGTRLVGLNIGETIVSGTYRGKEISLHVSVVEPVEEMTSISLQYVPNIQANMYAGTGERDFIDGSVEECAFVAPESMATNGRHLYIADSGTIRILEDDIASTLEMSPKYITADCIRCLEGDLFTLTGPWEEEDETYFGIVRISGSEAEFVFYTEAAWSVIPDFTFTSDGTLWFIWQNLGVGTTSLNKLDVSTGENEWVADLPESTAALAVDEDDTIYLAVPNEGTILMLGRGETEWQYFAGVKNERNFVDGPISNFYQPISLVVQDGVLYVLDFDTVRRVTLSGDSAGFVETAAGVPVADTNPSTVLGAGCDCIFAASERADLVSDGMGGILLSDPKNSVIYRISSTTPPLAGQN